MPTVLKAAGVTPPKELDGRDLVATIEDTNQKPRPLFWRQEPIYAMREGNWKLWKSADWKVTKLFNLSRDPAETTDVSKANPDVVDRLSGQLSHWSAGMKSPLFPFHAVRKTNICGRDTEMIF